MKQPNKKMEPVKIQIVHVPDGPDIKPAIPINNLKAGWSSTPAQPFSVPPHDCLEAGTPSTPFQQNAIPPAGKSEGNAGCCSCKVVSIITGISIVVVILIG